MASVQKKGEKYYITVSNGFDSNGKRIRHKTVYTLDPTLSPAKQKKALERFILEFENKILNGISIEGDRITFREFAEIWLNDVARKNLEEPTCVNYKTYLDTKINPYIGDMKLNKIKPHTIIKLYDALIEKGYIRNGVRHEYQYVTLKRVQDVLNGVFKTALRWELIDRNPCDAVKTPKVGKGKEKLKYLDERQIRLFLEALEKEYQAVFREHDRVDDTGKPYHVGTYTIPYKLPLQYIVFFYVALFGGLRRGENITLTWEDIDFDANTISINKATGKGVTGQYIKETKTKNSNRVITVPSEVIRLLKRLKFEQNKQRIAMGENWVETLDENGKPYHFVYTQPNGKQMYIDTPSQRFTKLIKDYNKTVEKEEDKLPQISLHGLRHTMATLLIAEGTEISTVSGRLGHSDISTTLDIYTHFLKERDKTASKALEKYLPKEA